MRAIDGETHGTDEQVSHDRRRTTFLEAQGYRVLRFQNEDVFEDVDSVLRTIMRELGVSDV